MAGVASNQLISFPGFPGGVNNKNREDAVGPRFLRHAENVDILAGGKITRRPGFAMADALPGAHSLYAVERYPFMLAATADALYRYDSNLERSLVTALASDTPMSFASMADKVFYSNALDSGVVDSDGVRREWAVEFPGGQPTLTVNTAAGGLDAGGYQVAITFVDAYGRESGATLASEISLLQGEGITLSNFPVPSTDEVETIRIYCSGANGDLLYLAAEIPVILSSFLLGNFTPGRALETQFLEKMPPGQIVCAHAGRLFVARGRMLYWSEAMAYGLYKPSENWLQFEHDITMVVSAGFGDSAGLYVATANRTVYLSSPTPGKWQRTVAASVGAVAGTDKQIDAGTLEIEGLSGILPVWVNTDGELVLGGSGGSLLNLHGKFYSGPADAERGSVVLREYRGAAHLVSALRGGSTTSGLRASDTVEAEVWKHGVRIS